MNNSSAYIITKPLQYINCRNIPDNSEKDLFIIDQFSDSDNFKTSILNSEYNPWRKILKFKTKEIALVYIIFFERKYSKLFLDSDFGIVLRFLLFWLKKINISVYEEGFASYVSELRPFGGIKNNLFSYIDTIQGGYNWSGGCKFTQSIYLYNKKIFQLQVPNCNKTLLTFSRNFACNLKEIKELDLYYNDIDIIIESLSNKEVFIYFSGYVIQNEYENILDSYSSFYKVLKPHPNMKNVEINNFDLIINSNILAEVLVIKLLDVVDKLILVHEGSFGMLVIPENDKIVEYIIANDSFKDYFINFRKLLLLN